MAYNKDIVEKLSLFNNLSFTKKQWDIILKGCGCPKANHFWTALRNNNLIKEKRIYTLIDINNESFECIWEKYCGINKAGAKKSYEKKKAREKAEKRQKSLKNTTLYIINGCVTHINPIKDEY